MQIGAIIFTHGRIERPPRRWPAWLAPALVVSLTTLAALAVAALAAAAPAGCSV
jgi:hypothetical protein